MDILGQWFELGGYWVSTDLLGFYKECMEPGRRTRFRWTVLGPDSWFPDNYDDTFFFVATSPELVAQWRDQSLLRSAREMTASRAVWRSLAGDSSRAVRAVPWILLRKPVDQLF